MTEQLLPYIQCPECATVFASPAALPAHGKVRCSVCHSVLNAAENGLSEIDPAGIEKGDADVEPPVDQAPSGLIVDGPTDVEHTGFEEDEDALVDSSQVTGEENLQREEPDSSRLLADPQEQADVEIGERIDLAASFSQFDDEDSAGPATAPTADGPQHAEWAGNPSQLYSAIRDDLDDEVEETVNLAAAEPEDISFRGGGSSEHPIVDTDTEQNGPSAFEPAETDMSTGELAAEIDAEDQTWLDLGGDAESSSEQISSADADIGFEGDSQPYLPDSDSGQGQTDVHETSAEAELEATDSDQTWLDLGGEETSPQQGPGSEQSVVENLDGPAAEDELEQTLVHTGQEQQIPGEREIPSEQEPTADSESQDETWLDLGEDVHDTPPESVEGPAVQGEEPPAEEALDATIISGGGEDDTGPGSDDSDGIDQETIDDLFSVATTEVADGDGDSSAAEQVSTAEEALEQAPHSEESMQEQAERAAQSPLEGPAGVAVEPVEEAAEEVVVEQSESEQSDEDAAADQLFAAAGDEADLPEFEQSDLIEANAEIQQEVGAKPELKTEPGSVESIAEGELFDEVLSEFVASGENVDADNVPAAEQQTLVEELPPVRKSRWLLLVHLVTAAALLVVISGLLLYLFREPLKESSTVRPWQEAMCGLIGCQLPDLRDPGKLAAVAKVVITHPQYQGALRADLSLQNRASFAQPFPTIRLTFLDKDEREVAGRDFKPEDYLVGPLTGKRLMQPMVPEQIVLEITDPDPTAVTFRFSYY